MPYINSWLDETPFSVFENIVSKIKTSAFHDFVPLHQGKTTFSTCSETPMKDDDTFSIAMYAHAPPQGIAQLKTAITEKHKNQHDDIHEESILITCGATGAIKLVVETITDTNSEVLVCSPQWLFVSGVLRSCGVNPIEVPVFLDLSKNDSFDWISALQEKVTPKTKAIYFNTPNNPTGYSLTENQLKDLVEFSLKNNLWIIADNAYELYDYSDNGFKDIRTLENAKKQTFSIYSFSKTYIMPGYRVGYVIFPEILVDQIYKRGLYNLYAIATPSQWGAYRALKTPEAKLKKQREDTKEALEMVNIELKVPHFKVKGGFYAFLDLSKWKNGEVSKFNDVLISRGVSLAPGIVFGENCGNYARLCFVASEISKVKKAIGIINDVYHHA